ncbi:MAG TPA: hypothetical protein DET40_18350 [Lentisphaeria bacterium]|nr:MAG: hypothetical protein A2X45_14490 [Lentisphaerae bacterium GWF2_50_93]HCE45505.1 hypothetical protein [Lentisphaeria bacterium]
MVQAEVRTNMNFEHRIRYGGFAETASEPVSAKLAYWFRRGKQMRKVTNLKQDLTLAESSPIQILMWDKPGNHKDFGNVLYSDGSIRGFEGRDWLEKARK